ncbi:hypothetical protein Baya_14418 [Bagarius yarrelli]|uniref:Uncharacterized protein n=1 Tax=Bagarius yarrelli TaxID=175774 RepID=A0A556V8K1_BAGYA|nr:hypothetical protein Baya_14418 [Bagarius yarrelli]
MVRRCLCSLWTSCPSNQAVSISIFKEASVCPAKGEIPSRFAVEMSSLSFSINITHMFAAVPCPTVLRDRWTIVMMSFRRPIEDCLCVRNINADTNDWSGEQHSAAGSHQCFKNFALFLRLFVLQSTGAAFSQHSETLIKSIGPSSSNIQPSPRFLTGSDEGS